MAGMMTPTMIAACIASMASFVAFPMTSPFTICSIRFLRPFSSFLSKITRRILALFANEARTSVR